MVSTPGKEERVIHKSVARLQRFFAIWRISGSLRLAVEALRWRCQEVLLSFLVAGGKLSAQTVEYRATRLPRLPFAGSGLAGVGYLQQLVVHGASMDRLDDGRYLTQMPDGLRFEVPEDMFIEALCVLVERFVDEEYAWLDVAGRIVVDVGANVGDSVLYFSRRRAIHVYGYEPEPAIYAAAAHNLALNEVENATIVRAAASGRSDPGSEGAPQVSLSDLLDEVRSRHPGIQIVCKIDCEGCEYEILASDTLPEAALELVSQIMIEYHWRPPGPLQDTLESRGFHVASSPGAPGVGWIRAHRK